MYNNDQINDGLLHNDEMIVKHLYKNDYPAISKWIKRNNGSKEDSDDIFQEALLFIIVKIREGSFSLSCNFSTYLFSISKHLWFQELKIRKKRVLEDFNEFFDLSFEDDDYDDTYDKMQKILRDQIARLDIRSQRFLLLCIQNKSISQIMQIMGFKNAQAVADKKQNCRKILIKKILNCVEFKKLNHEISPDT